MAGGKRKATQRADGRGSGYILIPQAVLDSEAYRDLTLRARCILFGMVRRFNGFNNGKIGYSIREMASDIQGPRSSVNQGAISRAVAELMEHGFIDVALTHRKSERMAREYRITFISTGQNGAFIAATNDYLSWCPNGKKGNSRAHVALAEKGKPAHVALADGKQSAHVALADDMETPRVSVTTSAHHTLAHIITSPTAARVNGKSLGNIQGNSGGPNGDTFMDSDELRERVQRSLVEAPYGAQTELAKASKVPAGTFSKFLQHGRGLSRHHRIAVQLALPAMEAGWGGRSNTRAANG